MFWVIWRKNSGLALKKRNWNENGKYVESQWSNFKNCCLENISKENEAREKNEDEKGIKILKTADHKEITFGYLAQNSLKQKKRDRLGTQ